MFELVDKYTLIPGKRYYVKRKPRYLQNAKNFECRFHYYNDEFEGFAWVTTNIPIELDLDLNDFYRYVSKEEFYAKVKEKYDASCLDIILKRLVNDDFCW
jgi:hypothetical protein